MTKNEQEIYDLLLQEAGDTDLVEETRQSNNTTQVCEEQNYNFKAGYEMPRDFQCAGIDNVGKYMRVGADGYIRPMAGGGGGGGYEPDFATIELTDEDTLAVVDYISATSVDELIDQTKSWAEDTFCLESFAVELDERVEELEEELTVLTPKVERALLTPLTTPTAPELVGIGTDKSQLRVKIGSGLSYNTSTDTLSATGGGSGEPVYVITGTATITDPSSIVDVPIVISSTNPYNDLNDFYEENGRLPRVVANVSVVAGGQTLTTVQLDLYANNVVSNRIDLQGALVEETLSLSYVEFNLTPTEQEGSLSSIKIQEKLTTNSAIRVKEIHFPDGGIVDDLYLQKIDSHIGIDDIIPGTNITVSKDYAENTITISATGGSGGNTYYLHTISFETNDYMHWQVGVINQSPNQFTDIQDFWTKIEKIVSIFGTPISGSSPKEVYFNGAMAESGAIHTRGIDAGFNAVVKDIALTDVDWSSFAQFGIEEL